jgi:mannosidase alpha-like ER degradation enhancer 2
VPRRARPAAARFLPDSAQIVATARRFTSIACLTVLCCPAGHGAAGSSAGAPMALTVKQEFLHAYHAYQRYAWGHDELMPLTLKPRDWYRDSLLMSPIDALDTLILMKAQPEADRTRALIDSSLDFDKDIEVKNFEITIRLLGGLLSAYQLTDDPRLLTLAQDLGTRLLPVFESPTGLPYQFVNLHSGQVRGTTMNPAETGTLLLEFGTLSRLTHQPVFFAKAKRALVETYRRRSAIGLVGESIDIRTGQWLSRDSHISGGIDSYYEYLWKCWKLFGDKECLHMWKRSIKAVNRYLADPGGRTLWYGHADMDSGQRTATEYGSLDAFFPALLAFAGDVPRAARLQAASLKMWDLNGIEPDTLDYRRMQVKDPAYPLRPEIMESTYYLYRLTGEERYRDMGRHLFEDFVKYCRTDNGYSALKDVITKERSDAMPSFVFAETFKYFYLLFAPQGTLDFNAVVFNTEAHPLRR